MGATCAAKLLIAADGADSKTRELLGIDTAGHAYHQDALVAHVRTAKSHRNTAWQRFLPTGPLAFLPLPDGRSSIVWSMARAEAVRLRALDAAAFGAALGEASGEALGEVELTTPIASFPLKLQYAVDYVRPRAVLLGDAAHAVHPLAGQGLNLGLLDCASLADVLGAAGCPRLVGEYRLLRRYERWRKSENLLAATALDGLERLFSNSNPAVARLRAAGLDAVGKAAVPQAPVRAARPGADRRCARVPQSRASLGSTAKRSEPIDFGRTDEVVLRQAADRMRRVGDAAVVVADFADRGDGPRRSRRARPR